MGLIPRFKNQDINKQLQRGYQGIENGILTIMQIVGENFVTDARDNLKIDAGAFPKGNYENHSTNLRSSIGYFVLKDGVVIFGFLEGTAEGVAAGKGVLGTIPNKEGYQLLGVAGMEYASSVESKGYNVITSQADLAVVNLEREFIKFKDRWNKQGAEMDFDMDDLVLTSTMN